MESKTNQTGSQEIKPGRGGKRPGAGRPKRAQAEAPAPDQVAADRQAYDSKLAGGVPSRTDDPQGGGVAQAVEPESVSRPSTVPAQPSHPAPEPSRGHVQDCALVPRPHDAQGGCCWARVADPKVEEAQADSDRTDPWTGARVVKKAMPLRVTWSPVRIDGTHGPRVYSTFAEWAASGGRLPVVFGKQSGAWVAFRPILENGRLGDVVWQDRKEYVTSRGGILEYTGKLDELERTPLPSLHPLPKEITDPTPADEVRRKIRLFGWSFPVATDDDDLIARYQAKLACSSEHEMAQAARHAEMLERQAERERLRSVDRPQYGSGKDFDTLMWSGA